MDRRPEAIMKEARALAGTPTGRVGKQESPPGPRGITVADLWLKEPDGTDPRERLTGKQKRVLRRIVRGEDLTAAARREGVHPERAQRWSRTPRFQRALHLELASILEQTDPTPGMLLFDANNDEGADHAE